MTGGTPADLVREVADEGDHDAGDDVAEHGDPEVDVLVEADPVGGLHGVGGAEDGGDDRDGVHQRHAGDADHVGPGVLEGVDDRRDRLGRFAFFFLEGGGFLDLAADDEARDDHEDRQQEGNAPAPGVEERVGHEVRERQEDGGGEDLAGLDALEREAREEAPSSEGRVLDHHRACARDFAGDREALDQPQHDEERRGPHADLGVGGQQADREGGEAHEEHAEQEHVLAAVGVAPVAEDEGADGPGDVADAVGGERGDDGGAGIFRGEEHLRENQRGRGRIDEEVIVFQRRTNPGACRGFLGLVLACRLVIGCFCHV